MPSRRESAWSNLWDTNTDTANRFDTYTPEFNASQMSSILDKIYNAKKGGVENTLNRETNRRMAGARKGTTGRLLSQGITGGSLMNDTIQSAEEGVLDTGFNSLSDALTSLGVGRMQQELPIMTEANRMKFGTTQAAQNADLQDVINQMRKSGMIQSAVNDWEQMDLQRDAQPGFLDDLFSGIQSIASIASIPMTGGFALGNLLGMPKSGG